MVEFSRCDVIRMLVTEAMDSETMTNKVVVVCEYVGDERWNFIRKGCKMERK